MEKSSHSAPPTTTAAAAAAADAVSPFLTGSVGGTTVPPSSTSSSNSVPSASSAMHNPIRMLNKASHKISKPAAKPQQLPRSLSSVSVNGPSNQEAEQPQAPPAPAQPQPQPLPPNNIQPPTPPVYNIHKNDFRDMVQKLTGSTVHLNPRPPSAPSTAPPARPAPAAVAPASATSSRLQRIRPPPLVQLSPRPPPLLQPPVQATGISGGVGTLGGVGGFGGLESGSGYAWARPWMSTPLSPLPPLPTVSAAAESPITAYKRRLQGGGAAGCPNALLPLSPGPIGAPLFPLPSSPLGLGCLPSPRSAFQTTLPQSPRIPLPSPKMNDH